MGRNSEARTQIMQAAYRLFYAKGYNAVGIQEICEAADVKKGSFYYFFPSKQALVLAIIESAWSNYCNGPLQQAFANALPADEKFYNYFQMVYQTERARPEPVRGCFFGNFAIEMSIQDAVIQLKIQEIFAEWRGVFEQVIQQGIDAREIKVVDVLAAAQAILTIYQGTALMAKTHNDAEYMNQISSFVKQLFQPVIES